MSLLIFNFKKNGRTALYVASRGSFPGIVDMIIKAERDKMGRNCDRNSILTDHNVSENSFDEACSNYEFYEEMHGAQFRDLLSSLAKNHLDSNDWKKLAKHWYFTDEQILGKIF